MLRRSVSRLLLGLVELGLRRGRIGLGLRLRPLDVAQFSGLRGNVVAEIGDRLRDLVVGGLERIELSSLLRLLGPDRIPLGLQ